jgi:hypothetical protein
MAHKVIVPQKKNYIPQFLKQRDINSYLSPHSPQFQQCAEPTLSSLSGTFRVFQSSLSPLILDFHLCVYTKIPLMI